MKSAVPVFALILSGSLAVIATGMRKANDDTVATRNQSAEQELKALERKLNELSLHGDRSAVTKIVADDFVGMDAGYWDGKVQWVPQDKAAFANDVVSTSSHLSEVSVNDLEARVHGQTGIVRGRAVFKDEGRPGVRHAFPR